MPMASENSSAADRAAAGTGPALGDFPPTNCGTPYVWRFDSPAPGPVLMISAAVHGNEVCGVHAIKTLLDCAITPQTGTIILALANPDAYAAHLARGGVNRYVDQDMNRLWADDMLAQPAGDCEPRRCQDLLPFLQATDFLLDLHSMTLEGPPLVLTGLMPRARQFAEQLCIGDYLIADPGHAAGRRMRDFGRFCGPNAHHTALLLECGQHQSHSAVAVALRACLRLLGFFGHKIPDKLEKTMQEQFHLGAVKDPPVPQQVVTITDTITVRTDNYRYLGPKKALHTVTETGTLIARDGDRAITTPYPDCILLMPALQASPGQTAVRLGRLSR